MLNHECQYRSWYIPYMMLCCIGSCYVRLVQLYDSGLSDKSGWPNTQAVWPAWLNHKAQLKVLQRMLLLDKLLLAYKAPEIRTAA